MKFSICNEWYFVINLHTVLSSSNMCLWDLQLFIRNACNSSDLWDLSPARSLLHATCTCGTILHPTCTYGTYSYSYVTLVIHHKSLCLVLSPSDVYLWDPSPSDQWDPTAYVSRVPVEPFSISIRPVGPSDLWDPTAYVSRVPVGPFSISI